jgi:hypothetical protein
MGLGLMMRAIFDTVRDDKNQQQKVDANRKDAD